jgi:signal transduction histidine kinase
VAVRSGHEQVGSARGGRKAEPRLDRVPFRLKLNILVALPSVVILLQLSPLVVQQVNAARTWSAAANYMTTTAQVSLLIGDLGIEQENALGLVGEIPLVSDREYATAVANTDKQRNAVLAAYHNKPPAMMASALSGVDALTQVRVSVASHAIEGAILLQGYSQAMQYLADAMNLAKQASNGNAASVPEGELNVLFQADLAANQREAALASIADNPNDAPTEYPIAQQNDGVYIAQGAQLSRIAPPGDLALFDAIGHNTEQGKIEAFESAADAAFTSSSKKTLAGLASYAGSFTEASLAQDSARVKMEGTISRQVVARANNTASVAAWTAVILVLVALLALIGLIVLSVLIRHSIVRPVMRLTRAATRIANVAEQDLERVADDDAGHEGTTDLEMVTVSAHDEIGDLADSFNRLQDTSVRVLERQVTIRRNTAEMFGNVGRRIYNLTGRQLALIDAVERTETDPVLLERLYRIDHLAVRLQRGADSLVLLSGERESAVDATPLRLTDVVRSAVGRIEGYQRVVLGAEGDSLVTPSAIGDLTLMIAELVENAVAFSPTSSTVDVAVRSVSHGALVEIVDRGVGMTAKRLIEENEQLVKRDRLDLAPTKVLGLFVVGRLAQRTGTSVELAQTAGGGLTARVTIPHDLLLGSAELIERGPTSSAPAPRTVPTPPMPEQRREQPQQLQPTAAGLPQRQARDGSDDGPPSAPLLPRRVRGTRTQSPSPVKQGVSLAPVQLDAEAARAAIEEFEAGVDQALRESARELPVRPPAATAFLPAVGDIDEEKGERP